jgi:hypothetical protein
LPVVAMFVNDRDEMSNRYRGPSIDVSYQVSRNMSFCHHLVSVVCHPFTFHILIFSFENPQPNGLKLSRKHLYLSFNRGEYFLEINQVSVHLAKRFQRRIFLKIDESERRIACGGYVC